MFFISNISFISEADIQRQTISLIFFLFNLIIFVLHIFFYQAVC